MEWNAKGLWIVDIIMTVIWSSVDIFKFVHHTVVTLLVILLFTLSYLPSRLTPT